MKGRKIKMAKNYRKTLTACYLGFITQAIAANFAPLLFLRFHSEYGIPLGKIALVSAVFYLTQLVIDVLCSYFADRIGYRKCVVASELCAAAGLIGLAFLPGLLSNPLTGIIVSVVACYHLRGWKRLDRSTLQPYCRGLSF